MSEPRLMSEPGLISERYEVLVIGGGLIGASVAAGLARDGRSVLVVERGPDWGGGASRGNAGLICPSHAGPWATRRDVLDGVRWMLRHDSAFGVSPRPDLVGFFARLLTMSPARAEESLRLTRDLCLRSLAMHEELAQTADTGFRRAGLLDSYLTQRGFANAKTKIAAHQDRGVACRVVEAEELREVEPALRPGMAGGVLFADEAHCDPTSFVLSRGQDAEKHGARLLTHTRATSLTRSGGHLVHTTAGDIAADEVVVAAGSWSTGLTRSQRRALPIRPGKGYSIDLLAAAGALMPRRPVMVQEERVAITPLTEVLRLAGTMQFVGMSEGVEARRLATIERVGRAAMPSWAPATPLNTWSGLRPCTPDGLPIIGRMPRTGVIIASGHAMLGLTLAPITAALVRGLLRDEPEDVLTHLTPTRMAGWGA